MSHSTPMGMSRMSNHLTYFNLDKFFLHILSLLSQGSHRLEKYLNIQYCLERSLKINLP